MTRYFRLDEKRLEQAIKEMEYNLAMENYTRCADTWQQTWGTRDAILEMPLGELTNEGIAGFVWAWNAKHMIKTADISENDRFNAQGLEGKVIIETSFTTALIAARELPAYRRAVSVSENLHDR